MDKNLERLAYLAAAEEKKEKKQQKNAQKIKDAELTARRLRYDQLALRAYKAVQSIESEANRDSRIVGWFKKGRFVCMGRKEETGPLFRQVFPFYLAYVSGESDVEEDKREENIPEDRVYFLFNMQHYEISEAVDWNPYHDELGPQRASREVIERMARDATHFRYRHCEETLTQICSLSFQDFHTALEKALMGQFSKEVCRGIYPVGRM